MIKEISDLNIINKLLKEFNTSINSLGTYSHYVIYEISNIIVGFISYDLIYDRLEIEYIYVNKEYRNKGIASKLMDYLVDIGNKNNCINISLEVRETNLIAKNFYKKHKFEEVARREKYYKNEDGILMVRELV